MKHWNHLYLYKNVKYINILLYFNIKLLDFQYFFVSYCNCIYLCYNQIKEKYDRRSLNENKKVYFCFLIIAMFVTFGAFSVSANTQNTVEDLPSLSEGYNRYFFLVPDDWFNEESNQIGIYWWAGTETPANWPGYVAHKADANNVYYYDVPCDVYTIIWNNYLDGGEYAKQTNNACAEYYEPGETLYYPQGVSTFNMMIYVTAEEFSDDPWGNDGKDYGVWFYYYGGGKYGFIEPEYKVDFDKATEELKAAYPENNYSYDVEISKIFYPELFGDSLVPWSKFNTLYVHQANAIFPEYIVFEACTDELSRNFVTGQFGDYIVTHNEVHSLYELAHYVYVPSGQKIYTLKQAWENEYLDISDAFEIGKIGRHKGDANLDDEFSINDASYIQKYLADFDGYTNTGFLDFDNSGDINIKDVSCIQKTLAKII